MISSQANIGLEGSTTNIKAENVQSYRRYNSINSSELKGYLTGLMLGDGCIQGGVTKRAFEIKSINKDFIDKIYDDLSSCSDFKISVKHMPVHYSHGCNHKESWELRIAAHPYFAKKYHHFYDDYKRRKVSREAVEWLTPAGIANWYMSDGYVCRVGIEKGFVKNRRVDICTDRYDEVYVERLREAFLRFDINISVIKRDRFLRLRIPFEYYERFFTLIAPYVVPSMRYKMDLCYNNKPKWMSDEFWEFQTALRSASALPTDNVAG